MDYKHNINDLVIIKKHYNSQFYKVMNRFICFSVPHYELKGINDGCITFQLENDIESIYKEPNDSNVPTARSNVIPFRKKI